MSRAVEILLVEDNPADISLTRQALAEGKIINNLNVVKDGEDALTYLRQQGAFARAVRPDLVLLDLNLPKMNGWDVLKVIKADDTLRRLPVVVLTTSEIEEDVLKSYDLHANCYITKPVDLEQFIAVIRQIEEFWIEVVKLPPE